MGLGGPVRSYTYLKENLTIRFRMGYTGHVARYTVRMGHDTPTVSVPEVCPEQGSTYRCVPKRTIPHEDVTPGYMIVSLHNWA